jgi:hypothetical protein
MISIDWVLHNLFKHSNEDSSIVWVSVLNKWIIWLYWPKSDETVLTMKDKQNFTRFNYIGYFFSLAESFCGTKRVTMITIVNFCIWFNFFLLSCILKFSTSYIEYKISKFNMIIDYHMSFHSYKEIFIYTSCHLKDLVNWH